MKSLSDQELAETETLLRQRLAQLADHAPTAVHLPNEVPVVALSPRRNRRRRIGVIAAVTTLIGAGGFTTYSFLGAASDGGASTPEEAVTTFVSAVENADVLGMIDVTLPEEVGVLRDAVTSTTSDATRLGLLGDNFDARDVQGVDISVNDLSLETNYLEGGLATVTATGGTLNTSFDPQKFPFGSKLRALLDSGQTATATTSTNLGGWQTPALLVAVERGGRWYVSVEYTLAEYLRRSSGWEQPAPIVRTPVGFDSPEAAVDAFYQRLAALDLPGAFEQFAPGEDAMAWLAQSWMPDALAAIERGRADGWTVGISGLTYDTIGDGSRLILKPLTFKVEGTVPAQFNQGRYEAVTSSTVNPDGTVTPLDFPAAPTGEPLPFTIERAEGCTTYLGEAAHSVFGLDGSPPATPVDGGFKLCQPGMGMGFSIFLLGSNFVELPAVSVVESGGKWYVSPLGTMLATVSTSLHDEGSDSSIFDTVIAPFLYGGLSRSFLETLAVGQSVDSVNPDCLPALTVENGTVTGVVADPPPDAVRACGFIGFSSSSSSGSGFEPAPIPMPTPTVVVPASSVP